MGNRFRQASNHAKVDELVIKVIGSNRMMMGDIFKNSKFTIMGIFGLTESEESGWKARRILERSLHRLKAGGRVELLKGQGMGPGGSWAKAK